MPSREILSASSQVEIHDEAACSAASSGLPESTGLRLARACSAAAATPFISGLRSEKAAKRNRLGCDVAHRLGRLVGGHRLHERLGEGAVQREIDLRQPRHGGETAFVLGVVVAQRPDVVERARFEA